MWTGKPHISLHIIKNYGHVFQEIHPVSKIDKVKKPWLFFFHWSIVHCWDFPPESKPIQFIFSLHYIKKRKAVTQSLSVFTGYEPLLLVMKLAKKDKKEGTIEASTWSIVFLL